MSRKYPVTFAYFEQLSEEDRHQTTPNVAALDRNTLWVYAGCDVTERSPMCLHWIVNKPMCLLSFRWFWKAKYLNVQKKKIKRRMFHVYLLFTIYANITNVIKENHYDCFMFLFTLLIWVFHVYLLFTIYANITNIIYPNILGKEN